MGANSEFKLLSGSKAYFSDPENILVDGTMTLDEYVREAAASKIGSNASTWTTLGSASKPIYLNNGVFTECNEISSHSHGSYSVSDRYAVIPSWNANTRQLSFTVRTFTFSNGICTGISSVSYGPWTL